MFCHVVNAWLTRGFELNFSTFSVANLDCSTKSLLTVTLNFGVVYYDPQINLIKITFDPIINQPLIFLVALFSENQ